MKIPKNEIEWVQYCDIKGMPRYLITSKTDSRSIYYLYEIQNNNWVKIGKAASPDTLVSKFNVLKNLKIC